MKTLLVEPEYYSRYPPLGLLKLASFHRSRGNRVELVRGPSDLISFIPDRIEITSLFTYAWKPVHEAIRFYKEQYPNAEIRVGGIYASLLPNHIYASFPRIAIHRGLFEIADQYLPAYDLLAEIPKWEDWDTSILFTSRGCIRRCPFCVVPKIEGTMRSVISDVRQFIYPEHSRITIWDNNFLASPLCMKILNELREIGLRIDFNQGLDARLINEEKASMLAEFKQSMIRMAFDSSDQEKAITKAIEVLTNQGIRRRKIAFYVLYNFFDSSNQTGDTPQNFFERIKHIADLGCVSYPMRYEPIYSLEKNSYVSPLWSEGRLEMIADARRVIGYGGAFPPYEGLIKKFHNANDFEEAFKLRPKAG